VEAHLGVEVDLAWQSPVGEAGGNPELKKTILFQLKLTTKVIKSFINLFKAFSFTKNQS